MPPPNPLQPGASLSDILTAAQNITQGLNGIYQTLLSIYGAQYGLLTTGQLTTTTLIKTGRVRVAGVSQVVGAAVSFLNDIDTAGGITAGNRIYEISATHGYYPTPGLIVATGLVFTPGAGAGVAVFYAAG